jgi:hypothetical protein
VLLLCAIALSAPSANAAVIHAYLPAPSEELSKGVPAGAEVPGALGELNAMTVDSGDVWIAEKLGGETRVDEFNAATGAFMLQFPQVSGLTGLDAPIAVGHGTPETQVYVGAQEAGAGVVAVFSATGSLLGRWTGSDTPATSFAGIEGLALDASSAGGDWAKGDAYVVSGAEPAVDVFKPEAAGKETFQTQIKGTCETTGLAVCAGTVPFARPTRVAVDQTTGDVLVVDSEAVVDVFQPVGLANEYAFVRQLTGTPRGAFARVLGIAVDAGNGDVYVNEGVPTIVDQFNAAGEYVGDLSGTPPAGPFKGPQSVAVDPTSHDVYVGDFNGEANVGVVDAFGPSLVVPTVATEPATGVEPGSAILHGTLIPEQEGPATCRFAYGTSEELGQTVPCPAAVPGGEAEVPVSVPLTKLTSDTTYFYRLQASNKNGLNPGEAWQDHQFTTLGPGIRAESVANVAATSATLQASVDPHERPTSVYFQYATSSSFADAISVPPAPGVAIGSGKEPVEVAPQHVQGLAPGTLYHYRAVALSEVEGHVREFDGPGQTFTTQTAGSFALPDERQWELVSPPDKHGALIQPIGEGQVTQAAAAGNAFTFLTDAPTEAQAQGYANFVQILARRGAAGWEPRDIAPPHGGATGVTVSQEYHFFGPDLSASILQQVGPFTPLSQAASEQTAYLRNDTNGTYTPLVTPANDTAEPFQPFGDEGECPPSGNHEFCGPKFVGATPDLKHVVLGSNVALTPGASSGGALYEWSNGTLGLVSLLPGNGGSASNPGLGFQSEVARQAISADGSRVIWSETGSHLYMRDMTRGETVQLDAVQSGTGPGIANPIFQAASTDGSTVYFTDGQALTKSASSGGVAIGDLYRCEMVVEAGKLNCRLSDLTPAGAGGEPARVLDLLPGVSEDGSRVYFVADGALAPGAVHGNLDEEAVPHGGLTNLYMWHAGVTTLVAVLSGEDYPDWNGRASQHHLARVTSRVSGNGHWLAFMSQRPLTGYDSRDSVTGRPDEEVYLYDSEHGRLVCASCDPSGARPAGVEYGKMAAGIDGSVGSGQTSIWDSGQGLGGSVPAWTAFGAGAALYQSRYLSNEGRLFFNSSDALVPADVNATGDVYQYEPAGVPAGSRGCSPSVGSGSDVYKPARAFEVEGRPGEEGAGCVGLISSGSSPQESGFLDASESGGDVFFFTSSRLSPQDFDTSPDVYDAHECSTAAPCYPQAASVQSPPCDTGDSCRAAPTPQPSIFGAPASATFSGPGNPAPPPAAVKRKTAEQIRIEKLNKALKACRKKKNKHKRQACEKAARKTYARKASAKKSSTARRAINDRRASR